MITIQTEIHISTATLGDVAITAAEGGIGYWAVIDSYRPSRWTASAEDVAQDNLEVDDDFVFYTIEPIVDGDDPFEAIDVTPLLLAKGIGYAMRAGFLRDGEIGEMDAAEADIVVQFGAFDEQVFA